MQALFRAAIAALAALLGFGLFALGQSGAASADDVAATRQDGITLLTDHDDDDDGDDATDESTFDSGTGESEDATGSRETPASVDRDISVDDLTVDRTLDGGDPTIDTTANHTNDRTRNDTRNV